MSTPAQRTADNTEKIAENTDPGSVSAPQVEVSRPPTTTSEQDLRTASQRRVNLIWEYTQAGIAITVVVANIVWVFALLFARDVPTTTLSAAGLLSNAFFLVIGFYFGRTNHARIGDEPRPGRLTDTRGLDDR